MSATHTCNIFVATCIDFRIQKTVAEWLRKNVGEKQYDRVAWAGGILDLEGVLKQLVISVHLHHVKKAILMNHEDCGAYGTAGNFEKHKNDLLAAAQKVKALYPQLEVETYYIHLDGTVEKVN